MARRRPRRARGIWDIGPYYSTDAGGRPLDTRLDAILPGRGRGLPPLEGLAGFPALPGMTADFPFPGMPGLPPLVTTFPGGFDPRLILGPLESQKLGVFALWAWQKTDTLWQEISNPETDVVLFDYAAVGSAMRGMGLGAPGWIAYFTDHPVELALAQAAFEATPYKLYSAEAVYNELDKTSPPRIGFVYWGQAREPGDTSAGPLKPEEAAQSLGGSAVVGIQVNAQQTELRPRPRQGDFADAYSKQFGVTPAVEPAGGLTHLPGTCNTEGMPCPCCAGFDCVAGICKLPAVTSMPPAVGPTTGPKKASLAGPIALGIGAAALGYLIVRSASKKRGRR